MLKFFRALSVVVCLGVAGVAPAAVAQVASADPQQAANARLAEVQAANERIQALVLGIVADPRFAAAATPEEMFRAAKALSPRISAARTELKRLAQDHDALAPLPATPGSDVIDSMVDDVVRTARMMEGVLGDLQAVVAAVEAGDRDKVRDVAATMAQGLVGMVDVQVVSLRGRAAMLPPQGSAAPQLMALACYYEGLNALNRAHFRMITQEQAAREIGEAAVCARQRLREARAGLADEKAQEAGLLGDAFDEFVEIRAAMQARIGLAIGDLEALGQGLAAGEPIDRLAAAFGPTVVAFERDLTALNGREVDLAPRLRP